ncbi:hypothetical protein Tco_0386435 [Tanacetum coccineum]
MRFSPPSRTAQPGSDTTCNTLPYADYNIVRFARRLTALLCSPHVKTSRQVTQAKELFSHKEEMDIETAQTNTTAKLPILKQGPVTTDEKTQKKNDVKVRNMLLMALLNEHLLTFNQYKDAKILFAAIQTTFGGNDATKKTQKTLLKQMYENFNAPSTESLDSIFNRLQKIIVGQEVKGTANTSLSSHNMAFMSSPSSTNKVNTANIQVSPASTQVSTASTQECESQDHDEAVNHKDALSNLKFGK